MLSSGVRERSARDLIPRRSLVLVSLAAVVVAAAWGAGPAIARWHQSAGTRTSIGYNQGITFDPVSASFFFDGVSSATNSALYRTDSKLRVTASNPAVIPATTEGYNHTGDLSFDPVRRRILLALECYYPAGGGNTCGSGAIGVADPATLRFLYYVNLSTAQIAKAMWVAISPDGRWIWTSSGTHLLVYRAADVNRQTADRQRAGVTGGITGRDLGAVLPASGVTGATFYEDALTRTPRLLLSLNLGTRFEVVSYATSAGDRLLSPTPTTEVVVPRTAADDEPEGLAVTGPGKRVEPLGGVLHWLMLPVITQSTLYSSILTYQPVPQPPPDGARVRPGQRLRGALARGLKLTVVCNHRCTSRATAAVSGRLARTLGLSHAKTSFRAYVVGAGSLRAGAGIRTLTIRFRSGPRRVLRCLHKLTLAITVRSTDVRSRQRSVQSLSATLRGGAACRRPAPPPTGGLG